MGEKYCGHAQSIHHSNQPAPLLICPFFNIFIYLSLHKTVNLSKYTSMATNKLQ